jgi:ribosome biogenesis protein BMS1
MLSTQSLKKKDSLLFAPLSNVGAVSFDKDAVYIDIGNANYTKKENLATGKEGSDEEEADDEPQYDADAPAGLLKSLQDIKAGVDEKMEHSTLRIFKGSKAVRAGSDDSSDEDESDDEDVAMKQGQSSFDLEKLTKPFRPRNADLGNDNEDGSDDDSSSSSDDDSSDDESSVGSDEDESHAGDDYDDENLPSSRVETGSLWKNNLAERAAQSFLSRESSTVNLQDLIYGSSRNVTVVSDEAEDDKADEADSDESDDEFFKVRGQGKKKKGSSESGTERLRDTSMLGEEDSSRMLSDGVVSFDVSPWLEEGDDCLIESIRDKFVTGKWASSENDAEEAFGDFEDFETGEKFGPQSDALPDDASDDEDRTAGMTDDEIRAYHAEKKAKQKSNFDEEFDEEKKLLGGAIGENDESAENEYMESLKREKEARLRRNQDEFGEEGERARLAHEGFRQGLYCRIRIDNIPADFMSSFDPHMPLVLGGLTPQETNLGLIRCRFKKHRWHKRILKCNDPLVFSMGWRRFQSIPVFSTEDQNGRHRLVGF